MQTSIFLEMEQPAVLFTGSEQVKITAPLLFSRMNFWQVCVSGQSTQYSYLPAPSQLPQDSVVEPHEAPRITAPTAKTTLNMKPPMTNSAA